ncbi:MAG TPA: paraquat-inducible protein A, partial [Pseudobdellovibrionaceae bacterium]|nr:paraquat-inducible protein A [Pseudobdellovibrionaceae bacterium]
MNEKRPPICYYLCGVCSHSIAVPEDGSRRIECPRCGHKDTRLAPKSAVMTLVFSLTALVFYLPANVFPFMTIELYGNRHSSTIWGGIVSLVDSGSWAIAGIVFLASMAI